MITVIICTYNRKESLLQTLESIRKESDSINFRWELIVVDNNSSDGTQEAIKNFSRTSGLHNVRYVFEAKQGTSHARNRGVQEAKGDIIVFTDDDVIVEQHWLSRIWTFYQNCDCDAVAGRILPLYPPDAPKWLTENDDLIKGPLVKYDCGESIHVLDDIWEDCPGTANMSFRKSCFTSHGFFKTTLGIGTGVRGEDEEFVHRLMKSEKKIYYHGKIVVWHPVPKERMTYSYLAKWYFGAGRFMLREQYVKMGKGPARYLGIPADLIREILNDIILFLSNIFDRRKSLKYWEKLFRHLGMGYEYKRPYNHQKP